MIRAHRMALMLVVATAAAFSLPGCDYAQRAEQRDALLSDAIREDDRIASAVQDREQLDWALTRALAERDAADDDAERLELTEIVEDLRTQVDAVSTSIETMRSEAARLREEAAAVDPGESQTEYVLETTHATSEAAQGVLPSPAAEVAGLVGLVSAGLLAFLRSRSERNRREAEQDRDLALMEAHETMADLAKVVRGFRDAKLVDNATPEQLRIIKNSQGVRARERVREALAA